jgi:hypothetical protein
MRLLRPEEAAYLTAWSRASIDRKVESGSLPSVTLHRGRKKRTYRLRAADIEKVFGIPLKEIEAFIIERDRKNEEAKRRRAGEVSASKHSANGAARDEQAART